MPIRAKTPDECYSRFWDHLWSLFTASLGDSVPLQLVPFKDPRHGDLRCKVGFGYGPKAEFVPISTKFGDLRFHFSQLVKAESSRARSHAERYELRTLTYAYRIHRSSGPTDVALLRWEYDRQEFNPKKKNPPRHHLHVTGLTLDGTCHQKEGEGLHLATGWVLIEEVLRFLHSDLEVSAAKGNDIWGVLDSGEDVFFTKFSGKTS